MSPSIRQKIQKLDLQSPAFKQAPEVVWNALLDQGPVVTTRQPLLGRIALTTHYSESQYVLRNPELFTLDARRCGHKYAAGMRWWVPGIFRPLANNLLTLDGDEHRTLRRRVDFAFRRTELTQLQPHIDNYVHQAIERMSLKLKKDTRADFVEHIARTVPQWVISHLLGLDMSYTRTDNALNRALSALGSVQGATDLFKVAPAIRLISRTLSNEIDLRRKSPRDDLISRLTSEHGEGRALSNDELLAMALLLYVAGHETTTHLLSTSLLSILTNPAIAEQIHLPLADKSIHEFVRFNSPVQMTKPRFVVRDTEIGGALLKRGDTIAVLTGAANRDKQAFTHPDQFVLSNASPKHLGFGAGAHACFGLHLALRETSTVLNALLHEYPLSLCGTSDAYAWNRRLGLRSLKYLMVSNAGK
ncbi:MAG: cytochrome P450 [Granulosicoccus sp.]